MRSASGQGVRDKSSEVHIRIVLGVPGTPRDRAQEGHRARSKKPIFAIFDQTSQKVSATFDYAGGLGEINREFTATLEKPPQMETSVVSLKVGFFTPSAAGVTRPSGGSSFAKS